MDALTVPPLTDFFRSVLILSPSFSTVPSIFLESTCDGEWQDTSVWSLYLPNNVWYITLYTIGYGALLFGVVYIIFIDRSEICFWSVCMMRFTLGQINVD